MPTKPLPPSPSLSHLRNQAKDLLREQRAGAPEAAQRIREFHPRFRAASDPAIARATLRLSDAYLTVAHEYGFRSWARLRAHVEDPARENFDLPHHDRIRDPEFRRAVELLDAGDRDAMATLLAAHPKLATQHVEFEGGNYFSRPTLIEFVAENPTRHGRLPANIAEVAGVILEAGANADRASVDSALGLVASSRVARDSGVQIPLIDVLCAYGADPEKAMLPALLYGETSAVEALLQHGATVDLVVVAVTKRDADLGALLRESDPEERQLALNLAAEYGSTDVVRLLLDAGEDPNRYGPVGSHSHATPLHQAALAGHEEIVALLLSRGARPEIKDVRFSGTPADWANYSGHERVAEELQDRRHSGA